MVRLARETDIKILDAMALDAVLAMHNVGLNQWSEDYPRVAHFKEDIALSRGYVYEVGGQIRGYYALIDTDPHYKAIPFKAASGVAVHRIFTSVHDQEKGIATEMFKTIFQYAKDHDLNAIWIDTHPANHKMQRLLHKLQFEERGFIDAIYRIAYERPSYKMFPKRILVFGNSGVGKSTLAKRLAAKLEIPYQHLDSVYWQENWQSTPRDVFYTKIETLLNSYTHYVMDGNYLNSGTMDLRLQNSDALIYLDYPVDVALKGIKDREKKYNGQARSDMAAGCIEKIDQEFLTYVLKFNETHRPSLLHLLKSNEKTHVTLRFESRDALNLFLDTL